jgi:hypothetical protein
MGRVGLFLLLLASFHFTEREGRLHDNVELLVVAVDHRGKVKSSAHRDIELSLEPEDHQKMVQNGLRVTSTLELTSGRYQLRVAAKESGGKRSGSHFYDIEIPEYSESDLVITPFLVTSINENAIPVISIGVDKHPIPLLPSTRRNFSRSDRLKILAEVHSHKCPRDGTPCIVIESSLRAKDGAITYQFSEELGMVRTDSGVGIVFNDEIRLSDLSPGDYLLDVTAREISGKSEASRRTALKI